MNINFGEKIMKRKMMKILNKVKLDDIIQNTVQINNIVKINIKDNKATIIIDIGNLEIDVRAAKLLEERCKTMLITAKLNLNSLNIILTGDIPLAKQSISNSDKFKSKTTKSSINGVKKTIAIASGKGGVGKSTLAVNLAISLHKIGFKIGLVDADIYGPSIPQMMNLSGKPALEGNLILPIKNYGIDCVSIGLLVDADQALIWRGPMATKTLNQLIHGVKWDDIDYLIIDLPPGTGDIHLSLAQTFPIDGAVIISTPQDVAVIDAVKSVDMFRKLNIPILGVVQNMAYFLGEGENNKNKTYIFGQDGAKKMAEKMELNFLGDIALDIRIREAGDNKNPLVNLYPNSHIAFDYGKIAENIIDFLDKPYLLL